MSQQGAPTQIDRDYVRLLMVMRRFVREEFNITVGISDAQAVPTLLDYAGRSHNVVLQEMGKELHAMLQPATDAGDEAPAVEEKRHYYRGVAQPPRHSTTTTAANVEQAGGNKRIYRGRVIAG